MIPAAGRATRLGRAGTGPKALLQVGGRFLAARLLDDLAGEVSDACVVVSPAWSGAVPARLGARRRGIRLHYAIQPRPGGVAEAVGRAAGLVRGSFAIVMGDAYYEESLLPAVRAWHASGADGAVLVEPRDPAVGGAVGLVRLEGDRVAGIRKAADDSRADARVAGMFIFPAGAMAALRAARPGATGEAELEEVVGGLIAEGAEFLAVPYGGWRRNINVLDDLEAVRRRLRRSRAPVEPEALP